MSVSDTRVIDILHLDKTLDEFVLTISDHPEWDNKDHLLLLQARINSYLAFIESGKLTAQFRQASGKPVVIDIACRNEPAGEGVEFLKKAKAIVENAGFSLTWTLVEV